MSWISFLNDDRKGKQRTRRLFSEINTKAVSVSGLDDLITNEENPIHINARKLYSEFENFNTEEFIALNHTSNIDANATEFTTILNLRDVNKELYQYIYKHKDYRPNDAKISELYKVTLEFWNSALSKVPSYNQVMVKKSKTVNDFRYKSNEKSGGLLLFRPVGIKALANAYSYAVFNKVNLKTFWSKINKVDWNLEGKHWNNVVWNSTSGSMIPKRDKLMSVLLYHLLGFTHDESYLFIEYNKAFGVAEKDKNKVKLPKPI